MVVSGVRAFQKVQRGAESKPGSHSVCRLCGMQVLKAAPLGTTTLHPKEYPGKLQASLFHYTKNSGGPRGPSQIHSIPTSQRHP